MLFGSSKRMNSAGPSALLVATVLAMPTLAEEEHTHAGDFEVSLVGGKLTLGESVLGAEMELVGSAPNQVFTTDEPGFDSLVGTFTAGTAVGFNILSPLGLWNGSGFDVINPSTGPVLTISNTVGLTTFSASTSTGYVDGYTLDANNDGQWHKHLGFNLLGDGGVTTSIAGEGIYLLELELFSTDPSISPSDSLFIVFNNGGELWEETHDQAVEWAEANLVPEPTTAMVLVGLTGIMLVRRRCVA